MARWPLPNSWPARGLRRRTLMVAPAGVFCTAALAACQDSAGRKTTTNPSTPLTIPSITASQSPSSPVTLQQSPLGVQWLSQQGQVRALASVGPDSKPDTLKVDPVAGGTTRAINSTFGAKGMIGWVTTYGGWVYWLDQDHIQQEITDPAAWRIYAIDATARDSTPRAVAASDEYSRFQPPALSCSSDGVFWTEWLGPTKRANSVLNWSPRDRSTTAWKRDVRYDQISSASGMLAYTLTTWTTPQSYELAVEVATFDGIQTVRLPGRGHSYAPRLSSEAIAWLDKAPSDDNATVWAATVSTRGGRLAAGAPQKIAVTEQLMGIAGRWVLVMVAEALKAIDLTRPTVAEHLSDKAVFSAGVAVDGTRVVWAEPDGDTATVLRSVDLS